MSDPRPVPDGIVVVDKPGGWTSHDVVARLRRLARTRRVGHAGTLDPMATGVLVVGIGRATRLLGHLALTEKDYAATIRLGVATTTDDADGEVTARRPVTVDPAALAAAVGNLTGEIDQIPSSFSAVKVGGVRSYVRARAGEAVELAPRRVTVSRFEVLGRRPAERPATEGPATEGPAIERPATEDLDVVVTCSSGTYIRALARDLGAALGCGAHLRALRRTRVGPFDLTTASTLDDLEKNFAVLALADAVARSFPRRDVDADETRAVRFGRPLPAAGLRGPHGVFGDDGTLLALFEESGGKDRPLVVFAPSMAPRADA
ncbi:MAG: tRNA pseudouridine(55) synthase TruB [Frankia sp.]